MVNQVVHKFYASSETSEDTESESELNDVPSPDISRSCFGDLLLKHQSDKIGMPLRKRLITSLKAATKTKGTSKRDSTNHVEGFLREVAGDRLVRYSLNQIKSFTWNFYIIAGKGGFGQTYKGLMPNGVYVAVKVMSILSKMKDDDWQEEFMAEASILSKTYHRNLVRLLGYCMEGDVKALVYEYLENGSLYDVLLNNPSDKDWEMLLNIAIETAKGISYLHEECTEVIVHLDVKSSNILLDTKFSPKLADFGLAIQYDRDEKDGIEVILKGTLGYLDPEFICSGYANCKCDVYSFGMVLFDILGRCNLEGTLRLDRSFPKQVWEKLKTGNMEEEETRRISMAALWCIQDRPEYRPSMSTVVSILKGDYEVVQPPYPFSSISNANSDTRFEDSSICSRNELITEFSMLSGLDYDSNSTVLFTLETEKCEMTMATSSANLVTESKTPTPVDGVHSIGKDFNSHNAATLRTIDNAWEQSTDQAKFSVPSKHMNAIPLKFIPYIQNLKDVKGDGNCGFRALADLLGMTENGWVSVRKDLRDELQLHREDYARLYKEYGSVDRLKKSLEYYGINAPFEYWMDMPDMGHIIASCYNVVLVHISMEQCLTFLPLRSLPLPEESHEVISIGFVNRNHFVRLDLQQRCPLPSIAERWYYYHQPCAKGWETFYTSRIKHFEELFIGENVALRETPMGIGACTSSNSLSPVRSQ